MTLHFVEPDEASLHTYFSRDLTPIVTIDSGDTVHFRTLEASAGLEPPPRDAGPRKRAAIRHALLEGHALCGPIAVRGAKAGMALAVTIGEMVCGRWGWTYTWSDHARADHEQLIWTLDPVALTGQDQRGRRVRLRPFMGILGMPPPEHGAHSTEPPRIWGGNLDCKELVSGSTLYLPIPVDGALFSTGDGHAAQGDGEVSATAIECPIERVDLTFTLHPDLHLTAPRAHTPAGWLTFGIHGDLNVAAQMAVDGMVDLMVSLFGMTRMDALLLATVVVDVRIGQMVLDSAKLAYAVLPHGAIEFAADG